MNISREEFGEMVKQVVDSLRGIAEKEARGTAVEMVHNYFNTTESDIRRLVHDTVSKLAREELQKHIELTVRWRD